MKFLTCLMPALLLVGCNLQDSGKYNDSESAGGYLDYARLFTIADSGSYQKVDVFSPWQGADDIVYTYYLIDTISDYPKNADPSMVIRIPVETSVCMSTTHVAMIDAVGSPGDILGVSGTNYITNSVVREGIGSGKVKDIGFDGNLNTELIAILNPDIVFVYGIGSESAGYISKLKEIGIPVLYICDYLEVHPLAKAEWVKLFGLLYGNSAVSDTLFRDISEDYTKVCNSVKEKSIVRPLVMLGLPYKDKWFISPGNSYISTLISDAGGEYLWENSISRESMPLSIESVYRDGLKSDYWLNIGAASSIEELLGVDPRFIDLPPVKSGKLYNNILRVNSNGGNDYWESGALYPNLVLRDIAAILHPRIFPDHKMEFYKRIE